MMHRAALALLFTPTLLLAADPVPIGPVLDSYPHLSPDNERVVFQSNRDGSRQLWLMNADGSEVRQLTHQPAGGAETPMWSPDGQSIVYAAYTGTDNNDVFVMDADGSNARQLTDGPGYDGHPHWSSDGQRIIFNSDRSSPDPNAPWGERHHEIWSMAADGTDLQQHTRCEGVCTYGSLSPDGSTLLYRRSFTEPGLNWALQLGDGNSEVVVLDLSSGNETRIASHPGFDGWPRWSPDGAWVVFASNRQGPVFTGQLWRVRPDGSGLEQLTTGDWGHVQPSWTFAGDALLAFRFQEFASTEYGGVARVELPAE